MMKKSLRTLAIILTLITIITSCKRTLNNYSDGALSTYFMPLQVGKYAIYELDSLNFYYYGQLDTLTKYYAKDTVEMATQDNAGRPCWLVVRYLSPISATPTWSAGETYTVTVTPSTVEVVENNMRFIKLAFPVDSGYTWSGNSYLTYDPYQDFFDFSDDSHKSLNLWNYTYTHGIQPFTAGTQTYDSAATVLQVNDSINVPIVIDTIFASKTYWTETYAKNVGLVYRHTAMWEYQPPTLDGTQSGYKIGFELTMTLLSHN